MTAPRFPEPSLTCPGPGLPCPFGGLLLGVSQDVRELRERLPDMAETITQSELLITEVRDDQRASNGAFAIAQEHFAKEVVARQEWEKDAEIKAARLTGGFDAVRLVVAALTLGCTVAGAWAAAIQIAG